MINVRPYLKKDFAFIRDICVETSWLKDDDTPINRTYLCAMYCDYYLEHEAEHCFSAADETDTPIGYILCSADISLYEEKMKEAYLPLVKKLNGPAYFTKAADIKFDSRYVKQGYTSHLHIDIKDGFQRQGVGTRLMDTLLSHLKKLGVEGVYLSCGSKNEKGKCFYKKYGFEEIDFLPGCVVFGLRLNGEEE